MSFVMSDHKMPSAPLQPVAPWRHTLLMVAAFAAISVAGLLYQPHFNGGAAESAQRTSAAPVYLSLIAMEWGLVLLVRRGCRRRGITLRDLVGGRWGRPRDVIIDVLLALFAWSVWSVFSRTWDHWAGVHDTATVSALLPGNAIEVGLWVALSFSAGFAEELVFRGYFQAQFQALTHRRVLGWVTQAVLFGFAHGYQGLQNCLKIVVYGLMMGTLVLARRSLRPAMITHGWTDIASGIFRM